MKRYLTILSLFLVILTSCSTDFDINGKWQDITIVYGLLNQNDSITYIKINKAFLGDDNAYVMASVPDSSEYQHPLDVTVEQWLNGNKIDIFHFDTTSIYNKDSGVFYYPKQILYKVVTHDKLLVDNGNLENPYTYKLIIHNPVSGNTFRSETELVYPFTVTLPKPSQKIMGFSVEPNSISKAKWTTGRNGRKYQLLIRFNYKEVPINGGDTVFNKVDWVFPALRANNITGNEEMEMSYSNPYFYDLLKAKIPVNTNVQRFIGKKGHSDLDYGAVEFIFSVASDELSTYLDVYEPSTGLVQEKPDYTNITGDGEAKGLGIFSSRTQVFRTYKLEDLTKERIKALNLGF